MTPVAPPPLSPAIHPSRSTTGILDPPQRFYSLDVLRGCAALCVVFWHWQHFYFIGSTVSDSFAPERQPLFRVFAFFYEHGWLAVDLFFSLSGFIFYWLYSDLIHRQSISGMRFTMLRFSRLYPLHAVTLLWVVAGQAIYSSVNGQYFVYPVNDAYHFVLNVLFVSNWGFEAGKSFNGPAWSVSVEVALYAMFFVLCRFWRIRTLVPLLAAFFGVLIVFGEHRYLGRGIVSFFAGGTIYMVYSWILRTKRLVPALRVVCPAAAILWLLVLVATSTPWMSWPPLTDRGAYLLTAAMLFPISILGLALIETRRGTLGKRLALIGDVSYSSYLIHFPLQLSIVIATTGLGISSAVFDTTAAFLTFFVLLLAISYASYRYLERPAQRLIRERAASVRALRQVRQSGRSSEAG